MAIFLVVIPRSSGAPGVDDAVCQELFSKVVNSYRHVIGDVYDTDPEIIHPGTGNSATVLFWKRTSDMNSVVSEGNSWAVSAGTPVSSKIVRTASMRADRCVFDEPVWGSYAAVWGSRYSPPIMAWNTTPALEAIHYGMNDDYIVISNRPLIAAIALADGLLDSIVLSEDYLDQYLLYGFNITEQSPFENVRVLDPTKSLIVNDGLISYGPLPSGVDAKLSKSHSFDEGVAALSEALKDSARRSVDNVTLGTVQLRMSGGKDSRLLLGLVKDLDAHCYAVTFGRPSDNETEVGYFLSKQAGVELSFKSPNMVPGSRLATRIGKTIALSDGLPASEPHTSIYEGSSPVVPGEGIMLGQWPLFKGGMAKKLKYAQGGIEKVLYNQASWMTSDLLRASYREFLENWQSSRIVENRLEHLYLFAREFRSGRWLQAHINLYERDATITYPLADSQVTAVSDTLSMFEKVSQRTLFGALESIWPLATEVPLSNGGVWRFEVAGRDDKLGSSTFEKRYADFSYSVPVKNGPEKQDPPYEYTNEARHDLAQALIESPRWCFLRTKVNPAIIPFIEDSSSIFSLPEGSSRREFIKFLWRLYVADVWLSREWLDGNLESE